MSLKHQLAAGATLTLGSLLLLYIYQKYSSKKSDKSSSQHTPAKRSAARTLLSKYNPRPTEQDIQLDNEFQGRVVVSNQVSEGGIVYHDIRYPRSEEGNQGTKPSSDTQPSASQIEDPAEEEPLVSTSVGSDVPDESRTNQSERVIAPPDESVQVEVTAPVIEPVVPVVAASVVSQEKSTPPTSNSWDTPSPQSTVDEKCGSSSLQAEEGAPIKPPSAAPSSVSECAPQITNPPSAALSSTSTVNTNPPTPTSTSTASTSNGTLSDTVVTNGIRGGLVTTEEFVRNVVRAKDKVEVERRRDNQEILEQIFHIPSKAVGKIIGKEGRSIKAIQRDSGARLKFPGNRDRSAPFQRLYVTGSLRQVEEAVARLVSLMPADSICADLINWTPQVALSGDLKPVELIENTVCIGRVTHVTSPDSVWIQICRGVANTDYLTQLGNLTDTLTQTLGRKIYDMKKALIPVRDIKEGTSCAVLLENRGYRGNVICPGTVDNDVHQVRLADFGTPHSFTELFRMDACYFAMPGLAVKCSLAHISKVEGDPVWPDGAAQYLEEFLANCFVKVRTVEAGHVPKVELYTELGPNNTNSVYVNRELVYDGYASWVE